MVFYEDGKKVRYNPYNMKYDELISSGEEVSVYKIGDEVIKFYKQYCPKKVMTKDIAETLCDINTDRILTPSKILYDKKHEIKGYKMKYIVSLKNDSFYKLSRKDLFKEMSFIHTDIVSLSNVGCLLDDLNIGNTIFSNGVYLIDPSSYKLDKQYKNNYIKTYDINKDIFNSYFNKLLYIRCFELFQNFSHKHEIEMEITNQMNSNGGALQYFISDFEYNTIDDFIKVKGGRINRRYYG